MAKVRLGLPPVDVAFATMSRSQIQAAMLALQEIVLLEAEYAAAESPEELFGRAVVEGIRQVERNERDGE